MSDITSDSIHFQKEYFWNNGLPILGQHLPGKFLDLIVSRKITTTDILVVSCIACRVDISRHKGTGYRTCNKDIAKAIGKHPCQISTSISKLKKLNIVIEVAWKDRRYLELQWSRSDAELSSMKGLYAKLLKKALPPIMDLRFEDPDPRLQDQIIPRSSRKKQEESIYFLRNLPYKEYLKTIHWKRVRMNAKRVAGFRCQLCNSKTRYLHAHHRTYERLGYEHPSDLIVLCKSCHEKFHDILPKEDKGQ